MIYNEGYVSTLKMNLIMEEMTPKFKSKSRIQLFSQKTSTPVPIHQFPQFCTAPISGAEPLDCIPGKAG